MKRHDYKGYTIDVDNLGRIYIYNQKSIYSESSDRQLLGVGLKLKDVKKIIDEIKEVKYHV